MGKNTRSQPGSFSRKTINILEDISPTDAKLFEQLCRFTWSLKKRPLQLILFESQIEALKPNGITFENLMHLENLGLLKWNDGFFSLSTSKPFLLCTHGSNKYQYSDINGSPLKIDIGNFLLTKPGEEIASIIKINPEPIFGYEEKIIDLIQKKFPHVQITKQD
jgi:hypothetical protein